MLEFPAAPGTPRGRGSLRGGAGREYLEMKAVKTPRAYPGPAWRRILAACLLPPLILMPLAAAAQPAGLPSLGDASAATLSPRVEQRLGDALMAEGRFDPTYIDDPSVNQYLSAMADRLAQHAAGGPPTVQAFSIRDPSINAFAMPGGYIGVHSGLVTATASESELAGVVAHEIAHVTQRHVARGLAQQGQSSLMLLGLMLGSLAAAAAGAGQLAMGAAAFGQAAVISSQLSFSREAEREADRVGIQMMEGAGYDPSGMASMFGRMMQLSRFNQVRGPGYASTHPLSLDRMSDMQNRVGRPGMRGDGDSDTYAFVRAKLLVLQANTGQTIDPVLQLQSEAEGANGARAAAAWYGVAQRRLIQGDPGSAGEALKQAQATGVEHPMLAQLQAEWLAASGQVDEALAVTVKGIKRWPNDRGLAIAHARLLQQAGRDRDATVFLAQTIKRWPEVEPALYRMAAESQARLGERMAEARSMADYYARIGAWPAALDQMRRARAASNDFHQQSVLDARIHEIQRRIEEDRALLAEFRR